MCFCTLVSSEVLSLVRRDSFCFVGEALSRVHFSTFFRMGSWHHVLRCWVARIAVDFACCESLLGLVIL